MNIATWFFESKKDIVFKRLYKNIPKYTFSTDNFIGLQLREKRYAIHHPYIQLNHENYKKYIVIDLDYAESAFLWRHEFNENIPIPNIIVTNPENGHSHFYYELENGVSFTDKSSQKAKDFYRAVTLKLTEVLHGDNRYVGLIAKTPGQKKWITDVLREEPYSLHELVENLELGLKEYRQSSKQELSKSKYIEMGRNDHLFNTVRYLAYTDIRKFRSQSYDTWFQHVLKLMSDHNELLKNPLGYNEIKATAKSIANYCWKKDSYCYQEFIDRQTRKGRLGGKARSKKYDHLRKKAILLMKQGKSKKAISTQLKVSYRTVIRWLNVITMAVVMTFDALKKQCDSAQNQIDLRFWAVFVSFILFDYSLNHFDCFSSLQLQINLLISKYIKDG